MRKFSLLLFSILVVPFLFLGCGQKEGSKVEREANKVKVVVSINPLKEFAEAIGGDKVEVTSLVPENMEPHDFEPKPKDLEGLMKSDIFVYNGLGMEEWLDQVKESVDSEKVLFIDSSSKADVLKQGNKVDPHLWLSLKEATKQAENIKNALVEKDSANKDYYEENYNKFKNALDELYKEYEPKFTTATNKDFVTSHAAFGYLCREFGLSQKSIADVFGESEMLPRDKENLIKYCRENNIKTIFSESSLSQKDAESLASEAGATVEAIYTLETKEKDMSYLEGMRYNLEKIYESLNK